MRRLFWIVPLLVATACAQVGRPPGGPPDTTPPSLATTEPGSLAVGVGRTQPLVFEFSEKVDRRGFAAALRVVPEVELRRPDFDDLRVSVRPEEGWPPDSVVVWTLGAGMKDKHGVALGEEIQGAFTTAARLPAGRITGHAEWEEPDSEAEIDWTLLRASLRLPPQEGERRGTEWRADQADEDGRFELPWLEVPSGPFDLQVWLDRNRNARRDEREPVAELDSLYLAGPDSILDLAPDRLVLVDLEGPVPVRFCPEPGLADSLGIRVWVRSDESERSQSAPLDSVACAVGLELVPGVYAWGAWIDANADGRFGADSLAVSEAWLERRELEVLPAHPESLVVPRPELRQSWAVVDTLAPPPVPEDLQQGPPEAEGR